MTHDTWPTPIEPHRAQGLEPPDPRLRDQGSKTGSRRAQGHLASNKSQGENTDEPQWPLPIPPRSGQGHLNLLVRCQPLAEPIESPLRGDLLEGGLRRNKMPHEGFVDLVISDGTRFCLNMPVSELTKHVTRAIEASDFSLAPPIVKTTDRVTRGTRPNPIEPKRA